MHACKRQRWDFPPLFRAEGLFVFSSFRNIVHFFNPLSQFANIRNMSTELSTMDHTTENSQPDSPAAPGKPDATPVSRSPTPPSGSHVPPQIQPEETEVQAAVETANANVDESRPADRSIIDRLKECIPQGSKPVLERVIHNRSYAMVTLNWDGGSMRPRGYLPEDVWEQVDKLKPSEHVVLVIEDISEEWCDALCKRYPKAINERFLLEHILGLDESSRPFASTWPHVVRPWKDESEPRRSIPPIRAREVGEDEKELRRSIAADLERLDRVFPCLSDREHERFGGHIYCWPEVGDPSYPGRPISRIKGCYLTPNISDRIKINRFLSYCQLQENFCKSNFLKAKGPLVSFSPDQQMLSSRPLPTFTTRLQNYTSGTPKQCA